MLYQFLRPMLFRLPTETAHEAVLHLAHLSPLLGRLTGIKNDPRLKLKVGNTQWLSPVGLAAGLDKNAEALDFFSHQGFGAIECGTVTLRPQEGNPRPRMFRFVPEESLRNAMGFPNQGLASISPRLSRYQGDLPLGVNLGKNKESNAEESIQELSLMVETLSHDVDYFVVNVSSPNTPGLRALQERSYLTELFQELNKVRAGKDLFLKIAPDLEKEKVIELTHLSKDLSLKGLIATNTTIMPERGPGGVSGKLLTQKAREVQKIILEQETGLELIGVGGISSSNDLFEFWKMGGRAVQVYTAYIYQGPLLLKNIQRDVHRFLDKNGFPCLEDFLKLEKKERQKLLEKS